MSFLSNQRLSRLLPIALSQLTGIACGVLGVKLVSNIVPPDALGAYGVFLSFSTVGMWLVHAGIVRFLGRNWAKAPDRTSMLKAVAKCWWQRLLWVLVCSAVGAFAVSHGRQLNWALVYASLAASAALLSASALCQSALQAGRQHWHDFGVSATHSLTRTFLAPLLYLAVNSPIGLYAGFAVHTVVTATVGVLGLKSYWPRRRAAQNGDQPCRIDRVYAGPLFTTLAAANWMLTAVGRWIVAFFYGDTVAGYFTLAGSMALIVPSVLGAICLQYFQPTLFALADDGKPDTAARLAHKVQQVVIVFCAAGIAGLLALQWLAPLLIGILIDPAYREALDWIVPCGIFGMTTMAAQFYQVMLIAARRESACAYVDLTTAAVLIIGSVAAGWAGQASFAVWLLLTPLVLLLVTRTLARHHLFKPLASAA